MAYNVSAYAMFASGIIARSAYRWQIWVEACGGTEQTVTAYAVLCAVVKFKPPIGGLNFRASYRLAFKCTFSSCGRASLF